MMTEEVLYTSFIPSEGELTVPSITTCFTPEQNCLPKILEEINKSKSEILVQAYSFNSTQIADALKAAHNRNVKVKILIDKKAEKTKAEKTNLIKDLENCGIGVQVDEQEGIAHNKVMIIDDACVITGSYNWTNEAEKKNSETLVFIRNECVASSFKGNFSFLENKTPSSAHKISDIFVCNTCTISLQDLFNQQQNFPPETTAASTPQDEHLTVIQMCYPPRQNCARLIKREIDLAKSSILVQAPRFTSSKIAQALINARKRNVDVKLLIDKNAVNYKYDNELITAMSKENITVIVDNIENGIEHNKVIIVDKVTTITGSYNLTVSAERRNSENLIFIKNFYVNQLFQRRWEKRAENGKPLEGSCLIS